MENEKSKLAALKLLPVLSLFVLFGCKTQHEIEAFDCEELSDSATFKVENNEVVMNGSIDCSTENKLTAALGNNPQVDTLVLNLVPGSGDDEANLKLGRKVYSLGLNTRIPDFSGDYSHPEEVLSGLVESGGVDLFLSGKQRTIGKNACIGVHSWADDENNEGSSYGQDDLVHRTYIQYYEDVEFSNARKFYFFTLRAQVADGIHYMSPDELYQWQIVNNAEVVGECPLEDVAP